VPTLGEAYRTRWSAAGKRNAATFGQVIPLQTIEKGHWCLQSLFIKPEYQRRGIGAALLKQGIEMIDKSGLVAYTAASLEGKGLYSKVGFESVFVMDEGDEESGPVISDVMCYTPSKVHN